MVVEMWCSLSEAAVTSDVQCEFEFAVDYMSCDTDLRSVEVGSSHAVHEFRAGFEMALNFKYSKISQTSNGNCVWFLVIVCI